MVTLALGDLDEMYIPEVTLRFEKPRKTLGEFSSVNDLVRFARSLFEEGEIEVQEQFIALYVTGGYKVIGFYRHSKGGITSTIADLRLIFCVALKCLATAIFLVHNHPSGNIAPSRIDRQLTQQFVSAGKIMEIPVFDHIILGSGNSYYSFAEADNI